tara:strand:- start:401 stop:1438 length:1038 start_codon:yes stop_codon:yes gene_type:complete
MSQENSLFQHKLFIEDKEILSATQGSISFKGNGQVNSLDVTIQDVDMQFDTLFNKRVELYLNESGSDDSVPIFRGFIKRFTPTEKDIKIKALDVRSILSSKDGLKMNSSDLENYDGDTVASFLYSIITDKVNYDKTLIGLDMLSDTDIPIRMSGIRGENIDILSTVNDRLSKTVDKTDYLNPLGYFLDVKEACEYSNIIITKERVLTDIPSYTFSYGDGLQKLSYKRLLPINTVYYNDGRSIEYTNRPSGQTATTITNVEDVAEARQLGLEQILLEQQQNAEIKADVSKCYDIGLGSLVFLDVPDDDIYGVHRVQGKKITFGSSVKCQLNLNKKPIKLSNYIQQE